LRVSKLKNGSRDTDHTHLCFNIQALADQAISNQLSDSFSALDDEIVTSWESFLDRLQDVAEFVLGTRQHSKRGWILKSGGFCCVSWLTHVISKVCDTG